MNNDVVLIIAAIVLMLLALIFIPQWRLKRAVRQVIRIFRESNAVGIGSAKSLDELGLRPKGMLEGMFRGRDYKQYALASLMRAEIVIMTKDGDYYLAEDKLLQSGLEKSTSYYR
ncbi:MAG TPA: hypothetical protein G4O09_05520 [Dehalococcoidia bacterium]|nr:hypothetical protein [Dehalococcoidia bacterium]